MGFQRVKYINFRNIEPHEIKLSGGLNLLTGLNGSGKTNILEGLNILSGWGPLESSTKIKELANRENSEKTVLLTGQLSGEYGEIVQAKIDDKFSMRINDSAISRSELRFREPVLTFLPNDTQLLEGAAERRRRLMDMLLALLVPAYAKHINEYRRAVRQKAALLKNGEKTEIIERVLCPLAAWIWKMRKETVSLLSEELQKLNTLVPEGTALEFSGGGAADNKDEKEAYIRGISELREKERQYKMPLVGPHRDDIIIKCNGLLAAEALSRGFRRRTAIALMLAAGDGVLRKTGNMPTLLLDEVTAELDANGREILFGTLLDRKAQVIAATAEPFAEHFSGRIYKVDQGRVEILSE